jgi:protein TonB
VAQNDNLQAPDTANRAPVEQHEASDLIGPVEEMPEFPGGVEALFNYIKKEQRYPLEAQTKHIEGVVYTTFVLNENGSISDAKVLRGIGEGCDEEALRLVNNMPNWTPGKQYGKPVKVQYNLPIRFTLSKGKGGR